MRPLTLGFSVADQSLRQSKSIGILNVSLGLLPALAARSEFCSIVAFSNSSLALPAAVKTQTRDAVASHRLARLWWDQFGVYRAAQNAGCDWLLLLKGFSSFLARPPVKLAVYVHDAMHDFYRAHYPGGFGGFEKWYFARAYAATLRHARIIFTNSAFTAAEVKRMADKFRLPAPRVVVAGIGFPPVPASDAPKENLITVPVSVWPHKLTARAVAWLARWQSESSYAGSVCLVGSLPRTFVLPSFANWRHLPRVATSDFNQLLDRSRVLVYFSEYEGFGMPPIEALLHGVAPVYSRIPAMMETSAGLGFPFANDDYSNFAAALNAALAASPAQLAVWAADLAQRHTWAAAAERIALALSGAA